MKATKNIKVYNKRERGYEVLPFCDDCLETIVDEWGLPAYEIMAYLDTPVDCENPWCAHKGE